MSLDYISTIHSAIDVPIPLVTETKLSPDIYDSFHKKWSNLDFKKIIYYSDGRKVVGFIVKPLQGTKLPCIIYNRGGSKEFSKIDKRILFYLIAELASWGYIVIASQYSGNDGSEGKDEMGGQDLDDVINLKTILDEMKEADSSKIGMFGASRGGGMTYMALAKVSWIKAAVIRAGSSNEIRGYEQRPDLKAFRADMYDVNSQVENEKRSALFWPEKINKTTPILLLHGTGDDSVSPLDSMEMAIKLYEHKVPSRLIIFEGDNHRLSNNSKLAMDQTKLWFDRFVINEERLPVVV